MGFPIVKKRILDSHLHFHLRAGKKEVGKISRSENSRDSRGHETIEDLCNIVKNEILEQIVEIPLETLHNECESSCRNCEFPSRRIDNNVDGNYEKLFCFESHSLWVQIESALV
jgi:hypothetical protein